MNYSIAFKNLPFEPEERQVIYVENLFDERINAIIKDNYESLKWNFKRANLDFVYLPMFFNDEKIKEKVLYYAPYLTSEIMEKIELRSSYLLKYMSHIENKVNIKPSFLYSPKRENDEWIFQGITIDLDDNGKKAVSLRLSDIVLDIEDDLNPKIHFHKVDEEVSSGMACEISPEPQAEYSSTPTWEKLKKGITKFGKCIVEEDDSDSRSLRVSEEDSLDEIRSKDIRENFEAMERHIKKLRLLGISISAIYEFLAKYETVSRLYITDDLRIFLPDYGNKEVNMHPLYKATYLTFVYYRKKGIVLQKLEDCNHELLYFYRRALKKQELTHRQLESINKLESSFLEEEGSIYTVLSRIKTAFNYAVDKHLAQHYYIVGKPGEPYNIANNDVIIEWEDDYE